MQGDVPFFLKTSRMPANVSDLPVLGQRTRWPASGFCGVERRGLFLSAAQGVVQVDDALNLIEAVSRHVQLGLQ